MRRAAPRRPSSSYDVEGVQVETRRPVTRLEANLPYGYDTRDARGRAGGRGHADARDMPWFRSGERHDR